MVNSVSKFNTSLFWKFAFIRKDVYFGKYAVRALTICNLI